MTLRTLTSLAISAHAAAVATRAVASLPERFQARWTQRAGRAEREAERRWTALRAALVGRRKAA